MSRSPLKVLTWVITLAILFGGIWAFTHRQQLVDNYVASRFTLSSDMQQIGAQLQLTDQGTFLLKASQATIANREGFNKNCEKKEKNSIVLGCYIHPHNLYVFNVTDSRLKGAVQTTTAHEMLHAVYTRLSQDKQAQINILIDQALPEAMKQDPSLTKRLELYDRIEPGERYNELHSIIGTEVNNIPQELEDHYRHYFRNRSLVVAEAGRYTKVMTDLQQQQKSLVDELNQKAQRITADSEQYNYDITALNNAIEDFNSRAESGNFLSQTEFDSERTALQSRIAELKNRQLQINNNVAAYNSQREELLALNITVQELNNQLDSTSVPQVQ
jgi:DNA repair exonuclease SbcCD ATPase subunit